MTVIELLHKMRRKLTPPGNRGMFDDEYRQPGHPPSLDVSSGPPARDPGQTGI
jgi:hypothetical protein